MGIDQVRPPWRLRRCVALAALLWWLVAAPAHAQSVVRLSGVEATVTDGAIVLNLGQRELVYVDGFGWLADIDAPAPEVREDGVYGDPALLGALGIAAPSRPAAPTVSAALDPVPLAGVRFSGEREMRIVLDLPDLDARLLAGIERSGSVGTGAALTLALPALDVDSGRRETYRGVELGFVAEAGSTRLEVSGVPFEYHVFAVPAPTRLVIDLRLERAPIWVDATQSLRDGVTYSRVRAEGAGGPTWVHVVEVAAGVGEWRVVGAPGEARTTDRWADGAFAAINGGYFDTGTRQAIGMLVVDGVLLSHPSRGRAVVAFGDGAPLIDRVRASYSVWIDGLLVAVRGAPFVDEVSVVRGPGSAGSARYGTLVVDAESELLLDNGIGPVRLSAGQFAIVYPAELRPLAIAEPGVNVRYSWHVTPDDFSLARYALEAGPLLLKDGRDVLAPELEQFAVGQRILDGLTQQAALGVRADGTTVLVAAESMVAADLVPLLQALDVRDALRLDSGGSTTLYADGRVLNRRSEREVVTAIVLRLP